MQIEEDPEAENASSDGKHNRQRTRVSEAMSQL